MESRRSLSANIKLIALQNLKMHLDVMQGKRNKIYLIIMLLAKLFSIFSRLYKNSFKLS